jgi:hypothetical protein
MTDMLISAGEMAGAVLLLAAVAMAHPRTKRVTVAVGRFGRLHMSPWMLAVVGACALIPGPLDEIIVFPVLAMITLRTGRNRRILRRYLHVAWNL